jgi:uncharacterized membrane protein
LVAFIAALGYSMISLHRYVTFQLGEDLAIFGQAVRGYSQFEAPLSSSKSPDGFNLLGDHFTPIVALLAPLYRLWPNIQLLLVAQALLFGLAIFVTGLHLLKQVGAKWAVLLSVGLACSWGLVHAVLFDFHEIAFAVPLLAIAFVCVANEYWAGLAITVMLLWITKEDCTFLTAGLGLVLLARRRVRAGVLLGGTSVAVFLLLTKIVIPALSYWGRYTYFDVVSGPWWQTVGHNFLSTAFATFLVVVTLTLGVGVVSPYALVLLPVVASRLASANPVYLGIDHHYNAVVMVICVFAAGDVISRLQNHSTLTTTRPRILKVQAVLVAAGIIYGGSLVIGLGGLERQVNSCIECQELTSASTLVPSNALVAADSYVVAHLVDSSVPILTGPDWLDKTSPPFSPSWVIVDIASSALNNRATGWQTDLNDILPTWGYHVVWSGSVVSVWTTGST